MPVSQSSVLTVIAGLSGTICSAFGFNAMLRPENALTFFEVSMPTLPASRSLVEGLMVVYGIRDVFMGIAVFSAVYHNARKPLGWLMLALSLVAFTDGYVCYKNGHGEWNHWTYAPIGLVTGPLLLGVAD